MVAQHKNEKAKGDYKDLKWFLRAFLLHNYLLCGRRGGEVITPGGIPMQM